MKIPSNLKSFSQPTLIVVTDSTQAKFFLADGRSLEEKEVMENRHEASSDHRDKNQTPDGHIFTEETENLKDTTREELYGMLSKKLMQELKQGIFEKLAFTVPADLENELKESLHLDLLKRANIFVPKLLTNDDPLDIVAHIQEQEKL